MYAENENRSSKIALCLLSMHRNTGILFYRKLYVIFFRLNEYN